MVGLGGSGSTAPPPPTQSSSSIDFHNLPFGQVFSLDPLQMGKYVQPGKNTSQGPFPPPLETRDIDLEDMQ